jgi:hypothetical protein
VLKSYFDCSGKDDAPFITLSGIATNDVIWGEIEANWNCRLQTGTPKASYMHMVEAVHLNREFSPDKGWTDDKVYGLINALLSDITQTPKDKYCQFVCMIDMNAYRKLQAESYQMDSPADILVTSCTDRIMSWYFLEYKGMDLEAHYYFDMDEPFEPIIKARWERELEGCEVPGAYNKWHHIKHIGTAQMRSTIGIQVADMLAWARNREETKKGQRYESLALALTRLSPSHIAFWDEDLLRRKYRPLIYRP